MNNIERVWASGRFEMVSRPDKKGVELRDAITTSVIPLMSAKDLDCLRDLAVKVIDDLWELRYGQKDKS